MKVSISLALFALSFGFLPATVEAAKIQDIDGGGIVYMDNAEGPDMIVADDFTEGGPINWDIYVSSDPTKKNSWELARTYKGKGVVSDDPQIVYNMFSGPAVEYNGSWYFVVNVIVNNGITLLTQEYQVWRIHTVGGKPKLVFSTPVDYSGTFWFTERMPLFVLHDTLHFVDPNAGVHRTTNGTTWQEPYTLSPVDSYWGVSDIVSNGSTVVLVVNNSVYRSNNAEDWTQVGGDLCESTPEGSYCSIQSVYKGMGKGVIAVTETYTGPDITTEVWKYKNGNWTQTDSMRGYLTPLVAGINGAAFSMINASGGEPAKTAVIKIGKKGVITHQTKLRSGTGMGVVAKDMALRNPIDASYIRLQSFGTK